MMTNHLRVIAFHDNNMQIFYFKLNKNITDNVLSICVWLILLRSDPAVSEQSVVSAIDEKGDRMSFLELADLLGHPAEEYDVVTDDGYILRLFRIPGNLKTPTLIVHGAELAADSWLLRADKSLGVLLAELGHDLWFANVRGNIYCRRHLYLDLDVDKEFWEFSFHEHGYYDLAATIDTILNKTNAAQINAIGHSQGTTMFTVLTSTRPEYNAKINFILYLAPIAFLSHVPPPAWYFIALSSQLNILLEQLGVHELFGYNNTLTAATRRLCLQPVISYEVCAYWLTFPMTGYDPDQIEPPFYRITNYYYPVGSSRKNVIHYTQVGHTGRFAQYDYGPIKNVAVYNSSLPPEYNLTNVRVPVVMLVSREDRLATERDAETLRDQLPNVRNYVVLPRKEVNHLDFVWGRNMEDYLYPFILAAFGYKT